jgi:hypothetical protein
VYTIGVLRGKTKMQKIRTILSSNACPYCKIFATEKKARLGPQVPATAVTRDNSCAWAVAPNEGVIQLGQPDMVEV